MKRNLITKLIYLILGGCLFFTACSKNNPNPKTNNNASPPTITSLNINSGPYYTSITVTGNNFSTTASNNQFFFNGKASTVEYSTATSLFTRVPLAAGTGKVTITVNGVTATGPVFTYLPAQVVIPFAGTGLDTTATDGVGVSAGFYQPFGLAIDASNNIYVADQADSHIRKITPAGLVTTIAGTAAKGYADGAGNKAAFNGPSGITVDNSGNIYVADTFNNLIRKITPAGIVTTLAGNITKGYADGVGTAAAFNNPFGLVTDANGNLYVTDYYNNRIRKITPNGVVSTFAGSGSPYSADGISTAANISGPYVLLLIKPEICMYLKAIT
jgi:hypothetical protein